jgi:hypothetical protein
MKYLISFPASAMNISDEDMAAVSEASHAVMREAKEAGVYTFGGGINGDVAPLMVAASAAPRTRPTRRPGSSTAASGFWNFRRAMPPSNGPRRSPEPAAARRNSASSGTIPRADWRGHFCSVGVVP